MSEEPNTMRPEKPPEFPRRLHMNARQVTGLLVLLTAPVVALFGVLGDSEQTEEATGGGLVLRVESAKTARHRDSVSLRLVVSGPENSTGGRIKITITEDYLKRFTNIVARPHLTRMTDEGVVIEQALPTNGKGVPMVIELTPERHGWARGTVRATAESGEVVEVALKTFVYP